MPFELTEIMELTAAGLPYIKGWLYALLPVSDSVSLVSVPLLVDPSIIWTGWFRVLYLLLDGLLPGFP